MFFFKKKRVQITPVSVKLVITIENNWMKVKHVQLFYNGWSENCDFFLKDIKFFFRLIASI